MRYIDCPTPGDPSALVLAEGPIPGTGPGDVLIRVDAAGVNRPDILQRQGRYDPPPGASRILGLEVAGTIERCGSAVTEWSAGDRVCALLAGGGYAEYCAVPAPQCLPIPRGLSAIEAAAIPETFFTVWANLFERGHPAPGDSILIHGGASGIGTTAIQLARAFGTDVVVTAGTESKCAACRSLGAGLAINYKEQDFVVETLRYTGGRGVDIVLDMVAGGYTARNIEVLTIEGRLIQIAVLQGNRVELDLSRIMRKRLTLTGSTLRPRTVAEKGALAGALREHVWPLLESKQVHPVIYRVFPLAEAADAHRTLEEGHHVGKIVLRVSDNAGGIPA